MKNMLKLEEFFLFGLALFLFSKLGFYTWGWYALLFLTPDLSIDRKSTRLNSSHIQKSRMPSSA